MKYVRSWRGYDERCVVRAYSTCSLYAIIRTHNRSHRSMDRGHNGKYMQCYAVCMHARRRHATYQCRLNLKIKRAVSSGPWHLAALSLSPHKMSINFEARDVRIRLLRCQSIGQNARNFTFWKVFRNCRGLSGLEQVFFLRSCWNCS